MRSEWEKPLLVEWVREWDRKIREERVKVEREKRERARWRATQGIEKLKG